MPWIRLCALLAAALAASGCAKITLAWADLRANGPDAEPQILAAFGDQGPIRDVASWEEYRAPALREAFEALVYGDMPDEYAVSVLSRDVLDANAFGGAGYLVEYKLQASVAFGDNAADSEPFHMNVLAPKDNLNAPAILIESFCPRNSTIRHPDVFHPEGARECPDSGFLFGVLTFIFGKYIATPPVEEILERGYAIATIYPSEFAPDDSERGIAALSAMASMDEGGDAAANRWGAVAAWGWGFSLMIDAMETDEEINPSSFIAWGHSRYGKAALVGAAYDNRIDGVIAHQSGTGGAALNRQKKGESVEEITSSYPHWFNDAYAEFADREEELPIDQHHLLALIAPRPILLGNARRDVWSDPNGSFRAGLGATAVYELYGVDGLTQARLDEWRPGAHIAFHIRAGGHGVTTDDWPRFLEFLDAHFGVKPSTPS
ncbi:MAG: alpha/beta hydrolase [Pseudomonadota bacterium]